jgi:sec-independent protein translocase protein TatA
VPELLIILGILVLVLGVGRLGKIGGELGSAIRNFREGLGDKDKKDETPAPPADSAADKPADKV